MGAVIPAWLTALTLAGFAAIVQAGSVEDACDLAHAKLRPVPNVSLDKSVGTFSDGDDSYRGCTVRLKGDRTKINDALYPEPLFYPFEGSAMYRSGWRADRQADGPDGTAFRITKQNVFCLVEGSWDGGDDSDPKYVPSMRYEVVVSCANLKR